jgi:hypothetical protein
MDRAKIVYELDKTKSKLAWKADVISYVEKAFHTYDDDLGSVSACIHEYLARDHGVNNWCVFAYTGGDSSLWYLGDYSCRLQYQTSKDLYQVKIISHPNTGYLAKTAVYNSSLADKDKVVLLEKGSVDEYTLYRFYGPCLMSSGNIDIQKIKLDIKAKGPSLGIGTEWSICGCKRGAYAGNYMDGQYAIFQFKDNVYINVRVK